MSKQIKQNQRNSVLNVKQQHYFSKTKILIGSSITTLVITLLVVFSTAVFAQSSTKEVVGGDELVIRCQGKALQKEYVSRTSLYFFCEPSNDAQPPVDPTPAPPEPPTPAPDPGVPVPPPSSNALYVAPNGNDANPGTVEKPLRTIQKAVGLVSLGQIIYVRGGTYVEDVVINKSGTSDQPIIIAAYPGEKPLVDGQYTLPPKPSSGWAKCNTTVSPPKCFHYGGLIKVQGSHIVIDGLEIAHSLGRGLIIGSEKNSISNVTVRNSNIHDNRNAGTIITNARDVVYEGNQVWHSSDYATHQRSASVLNWPIAVNTVNAHNVTFRNNRIFENWTEGIAAGRDSTNIIIENNEIYDNFALQIYVHRAQNVSVHENMVYCTNNPLFLRGGNLPHGIILNNESNFTNSLIVDNAKIMNNVVVGCRQGLGIWGGGGTTKTGSRNVTVAHNTFVNAMSNPGKTEAVAINIIAASGYRNVRFENNIILQSQFRLASVPSDSQISFANNLWSSTPPATASGAGDLIGNPLLVNANASLSGSRMNPENYIVQADSIAINRGGGTSYVAEDFFGNQRDGRADVGFYEFVNR